MRKCLNCDCNMRESGRLRLSNSPLANVVVKRNGEFEKVNVLVCSNCGKLELYVSIEDK